MALSLWEFLAASVAEAAAEEDGEEEAEGGRGVVGGGGGGGGGKEDDRVGGLVVGGGGKGKGSGMKRGAGRVVRGFLRRRRRQRAGKASELAGAGCPFCSGNCHAYHQLPNAAQPPQKGRQQKGEDGFWQREDLAKGQGLPGTRSEGWKRALFASLRDMFNE